MSAMLIIMPAMMFGGYFVNLKDVYPWLRWITYLSPIRYASEALIRNEFEDNNDYTNGENYYESLDYNVGKWWSLFLLIAMSVFFRLLAAVSLRLTISKVQ
mmetsp:Transcript_13231/g.11713  ORF Transcript_13231/g.11713 Transcript_13231/m.11713 type:complete len:101 (+) Transcript_13231:289-591(+)